jgi:hypothetical protein
MARVGFVLSKPHWEYTRNKTVKTRTYDYLYLVLRRPYFVVSVSHAASE